MPNYNKNTKLAYGVVSGNTFFSLMEDIQSHGTNVSFEEYRASLRQPIQDLLERVGIYRTNIQGALEDIMDVLDDYMEYEGEEDNYTAEIENTKYEISWLGGAPLIWVINSEWACYCKPCSPCVPGAGDLDSLGGSTLAHCMPPSEWKVVFDEGYEDIPQTLTNISTGADFDLWEYCGKKEEQ